MQSPACTWYQGDLHKTLSCSHLPAPDTRETCIKPSHAVTCLHLIPGRLASNPFMQSPVCTWHQGDLHKTISCSHLSAPDTRETCSKPSQAVTSLHLTPGRIASNPFMQSRVCTWYRGRDLHKITRADTRKQGFWRPSRSSNTACQSRLLY